MKEKFNMFACTFACMYGILTITFILYGITAGADVRMIVGAASEAAPVATLISAAFASTVVIIYWIMP